MATNKIIKTLTANAYNGTFETTNDGISVSGSFSTDGSKTLTGINADVKEGSAPIGNFNGWWNGEKMIYNFNGIEDISKLIAVAQAAESTVQGIAAELLSS